MQTYNLKARQRKQPRSRSPHSGKPAVRGDASGAYAPLSRVAHAAGLVIIAGSVVGGFFIHPAIGVGLAILAALRLWILRREERRLKQEEPFTTSDHGGAAKRVRKERQPSR